MHTVRSIIVELRRRGVMPAEISRRLGVSVATVRRHLGAAETPKRRRPADPLRAAMRRVSELA